MPFRLIMSDIDGTFLNSQKQIPSETIKICRRLYQEKKTRFALASGRGMAGIIIICYNIPSGQSKTLNLTGSMV